MEPCCHIDEKSTVKSAVLADRFKNIHEHLGHIDDYSNHLKVDFPNSGMIGHARYHQEIMENA